MDGLTFFQPPDARATVDDLLAVFRTAWTAWIAQVLPADHVFPAVDFHEPGRRDRIAGVDKMPVRIRRLCGSQGEPVFIAAADGHPHGAVSGDPKSGFAAVLRDHGHVFPVQPVAGLHQVEFGRLPVPGPRFISVGQPIEPVIIPADSPQPVPVPVDLHGIGPGFPVRAVDTMGPNNAHHVVADKTGIGTGDAANVRK